MIESAILREKQRVQKKLEEESSSVHDYLLRSHFAAKQIAASHGFNLHYADLPNKGATSDRVQAGRRNSADQPARGGVR